MTDLSGRYSPQLEILTLQEDSLMQILDQAEGFAEQRNQYLHTHGVFRRYTELYAEYVGLITSSDSAERIEALKRALFIQWFAVSEPPFLTGIAGTNIFGNIDDLDFSTQFTVLYTIQDLISMSAMDSELIWMLDWYYRITDWYFEPEAFAQLETLLTYLKNRKDIKHWVDNVNGLLKPEPDSLVGRGQMGKYWLSLLQRSESST